MVSRKRERKRWRTETKLPCNTIYIARVCVCARFFYGANSERKEIHSLCLKP